MKTQAECYEALLRGEKLRHSHFGIVYLAGGILRYINNKPSNVGFSEPHEWEIHALKCVTCGDTKAIIAPYSRGRFEKEPCPDCVTLKRKVRYAPALFKGLNHVALSNVLYESKEKAKLDYGDSLICWLIDTPYTVELEE